MGKGGEGSGEGGFTTYVPRMNFKCDRFAF